MRIVNFLAPAVLALSLATATGAIAQVTDHLGLAGPISVGDESFELAWSSNPQDGYIKHEYVPAGQSVEQFEDMVLVETLVGAIDPMSAVAAQVENLNQTRAGDPVFNSAVMENEASGEVVLDFLLSEQDAQGEYMIEWSAYRYAPIETDAGEPALMLFGIVHRAYGNDESQTFLEGLSQLRTTQIDALASAPLPRPKI